MPLSSWQRLTGVDILLSQDPWRPHHMQDTVGDSPYPHSSGPHASGNCRPPLPPQDEPPRPPLGLRGRHCASSSASSSAAIQVGPVPRMWDRAMMIFSRASTLMALRLWKATLKMAFGTRTRYGGCTYKRQPGSCIQCSQRKTGDGSTAVQQTRISILSWNPGPRRGTPGAIENHVAAQLSVSWKTRWVLINGSGRSGPSRQNP